MMNLLVLFFLSMVAGFIVTWYATKDLGSGAVFFTYDEEIQVICQGGLRNGEDGKS
tara:strand:+ start:320 stop:487 length:168 start_codon:yes stop_codon:yes gene_type:complete